MPAAPPNVVCPACGHFAMPTMTEHGVRHDHCGLHSWGGKPLVDQETHNARQEAHRYFDALWKYSDHTMTRSEAYKKLAEAMGVPKRDCHISRMDKAQALSVKDYVKQIQTGTNIKPEGEANART